MSIADSISFEAFCQLCTKLSGVPHDKKRGILDTFIENWKLKGEELKKDNSNLDCSFYPVLRLLLPQLDRERGAYGVKELTLAKIYIRILCLPKDGRDAVKLLEYRAPKTAGNQTGDFAEIAFWILKSRCSAGGQLSIEDVNNHLNAVADRNAHNEPRGVDAELVSLLRSTSAEEQKWIIRILLRDMKLGVGQGTILNAYHPDARDLYDATNNLLKICEKLNDPKVRLHEVEIKLFSPFRPMLSEECDVTKVDIYLKKASFLFIETKLDGERFQLHMENGKFQYFSRNGRDYTCNFGSDRSDGLLTPKLSKQIKSDVQSLILDGEMMCWNPKTKHYVTKGQNTDVKNLKDTNPYRPCFCVFDILLCNGQVLTNKPLNYRLEKLEQIVTPLEGVINFVSRKMTAQKEDVLTALNDAIDNQEEGIVLKELTSVYKPNARKHGGWYKVKPEYTDGLMDTVDVLILGGYYGGGRHHGNISHFLLGVAVSSADGSEPKMFHSIARVGSGYSMEELLELQMKLQPYWKPVVPGNMPSNIEWTKEKPDLWIEPSKSFILEIKASEIMVSDCFKTGYTFRFPRVQKVRYDKSWKDCLTTAELEEKKQSGGGKLFLRHVNEGDTSDDSPTKAKKKSPRVTATIGAQFRATDVSGVEVISTLLENKEICVFSGFGEFKKSDVEKKIVEYGGTFVQNPGSNTFCVLAEEESTVRIKNVIKSKSHDVVKTSWFISQLTPETAELPEFKPENLLGMSRRTGEEFSVLYDEFGDHYTEPATIDNIQYAFNAAKKRRLSQELTIDEKYEMDVELFSGPSPYSIFRLCVAYFDWYPIIDDPTSGILPELKLSEFYLTFNGGLTSETLNDEVTHVIFSKSDLSRLNEIKRLNRENRRKFHLVTEEWVESCLTSNMLLDEREFYPKGF